MKSYIYITNNSDKYIYNVLSSLLPMEDDEELIIFDNLSTDETVPIIVGTVGERWKDTEHYKFYINKTKEKIGNLKSKALSIAKGEPIFINKRKPFRKEELQC